MVRTPISQLSAPTAARSLTAWATENLRRAVLDGRFEPGERLDQDALADELGVSRTPIREAIAALESEGLLESKPYRGVYVTVVSAEDIREVFALRALLEAEVVRQAVSSIPDSVLDALETMLKEAQEAYDNGDQAAQFDADRHFHKTLREFAANSLLREVLDGVNNRVTAVRRFAQTKPGPHVDEFAREHLEILRSIRQRDPDKAASLMKLHLENSGLRVQELAEP